MVMQLLERSMSVSCITRHLLLDLVPMYSSSTIVGLLTALANLVKLAWCVTGELPGTGWLLKEQGQRISLSWATALGLVSHRNSECNLTRRE